MEEAVQVKTQVEILTVFRTKRGSKGEETT